MRAGLLMFVAASALPALPAAAQTVPPPVSNVAVGTTAAGRDQIDLNTVPPARAEVGLSGSAAADAAFGKAGAADTGAVPAPRHGVERNARHGTSPKAAETPPR